MMVMMKARYEEWWPTGSVGMGLCGTGSAASDLVGVPESQCSMIVLKVGLP